jgi:hypothetical protein
VKFIKDNLVEITILLGMALVSIGLFLISSIVGCIGTGLMSWGLAYLIKIGGD